MAEESPTRRTVLIAGAANLFVGVIKLAAGILAGSSAMLAEAAHSAADTLNQAFLLASLHRGEPFILHGEFLPPLPGGLARPSNGRLGGPRRTGGSATRPPSRRGAGGSARSR